MARVVAHELGYGRWKLYHPFRQAPPRFEGAMRAKTDKRAGARQKRVGIRSVTCIQFQISKHQAEGEIL